MRYRWPEDTQFTQVVLTVEGKTDKNGLAEMVKAKKVQKFSVTQRQVTLYLGDVKAGDTHSFSYSLKPRFPVRASAPALVAYEYYTPANRATARPVLLVVEDKK